MEMKENTMETTEKTAEKKGAKSYSLVGQIFASFWIGGWNAFQFVKDVSSGKHIEVSDIVYSGIAIVACFSPVYFSILFDKIREIRFGK